MVKEMNLDALRLKIDAIDDKIVALINERCKIASEVGAWKKQRAHAIYVPEREKQLFERLHAKNEGPISSSALRSIYREIISGAIALEKPLKIIYFKSMENSANAARETFGDSAKYIPSDSMDEILNKLEKEDIDYGVIPLIDQNGHFAKEIISDLIKHDEIKICAERIGNVDGSNGSYLIIGLQETVPSIEDRTAVAIKGINHTESYSETIDSRLNIFTLSELNCETPTIFIEFSGHPANKETKKALSKLEHLGTVKILGGYPVLYT